MASFIGVFFLLHATPSVAATSFEDAREAAASLALEESPLTEGAYLKALKLGEQELRGAAQDLAKQHDVAMVEFDLGDYFNDHGAAAKAKARFEAFLKTVQRLIRAEPTMVKWHRDLTMVYQRLARLAANAGKAEEELRLRTLELAEARLLTQKDPSNSDWQLVHGIALNDFGVVQRRLGLEKALGSFLQAQEVFSPLVERQPEDVELLDHLSFTLSELYDLYQALGRDADAEATLPARVRVAETLMTVAHDDVRLLGRCADVFEDLGNAREAQPEEARRAFRQAVRLRERRVVIDSSLERITELASSRINLADAITAAGDRPAAHRELKAIEESLEQAVANEPRAERPRFNLSIVYSRLGSSELADGRPSTSERYHRLGVEVLEKLLKASPKTEIYKESLVTGLVFLGDAMRYGERPGEAATPYQRALRLQQEVSSSRKSPDDGQRRQLGVIYERLGLVAEREGRVTEAERAYAQTVTIFSELVERAPTPQNWRALCVAHDNMGDVHRTQGLLTKSEQSYLASLALREVALRTNPDDAERKYDVSLSLRRLAAIEASRGATGQERVLKDRARTLLRESVGAAKARSAWTEELRDLEDSIGVAPGEKDTDI